MIEQDHSFHNAFDMVISAHKPSIGLILICLSYFLSVIVFIDCFLLYDKFNTSNPIPSNLYSLFYQYNSHRGVYFNKFFIMTFLLMLIILSFTTGVTFLQSLDNQHFFFRLHLMTGLFFLYALLNVLPIYIISFFTEDNHALNVRDQLSIGLIFFLLTSWYYYAWKKPHTKVNKILLLTGLIILCLSVFMELLAIVVFATAPRA